MSLTFRQLGLSLSFVAFAAAGCSIGTTDLTQEASYSPVVGQRYRTKVDMYLFTETYGKHPYIGLNDPKAIRGAKTLPKTISNEYLGKTFRGATVVDIVPAGSKLVSKRVLRDVSSQGDIVFFICSLEYNGKQVSLVDTYFVQSGINGRDGRLPEIDPTIAEKVP